MSRHTFRGCCGLLALGFVALSPLRRDQPIMNMMPRWDGGYGFQVRAEHIHRSDLKQGSDVVGRGFTEDLHQFHLEGVYTWDRSIRLTAKLPYVGDARREVPGAGGQKVVQHDEGIGDLTLALPLKHYFNLDARSGSWTLAPQLRIPLGREDDEFEVWDGVWGSGLSFGYETETYHLFLATSSGFWMKQGLCAPIRTTGWKRVSCCCLRWTVSATGSATAWPSTSVLGNGKACGGAIPLQTAHCSSGTSVSAADCSARPQGLMHGSACMPATPWR